MPSTPPKIQQQQINGTSVSPAMLNSLVHFLQHNKMFSSCSAPNAATVPTFPGGATQSPVAPTTTMTGINCTNLHNNCAKTDHFEMINTITTNESVQQANGMDTTSSALFAKTVDSLHNFLSPNVVLLPVAFHSLNDEQHIQLLGMPQTVIPIAIHPSMQKQFAVRPLLVDQTMAVSDHQQQQNGLVNTTTTNSSSCSSSRSSTTSVTVPKRIGIGRVGGHKGSECCGGGGETEQFQLPVAFRSSFVHSPSQNQQQQQPQHHQQHIISPVMECISHPKRESHLSPSSVGKFGDDDDDDHGKTEPLDLSLSARTKANENEGGDGMGAFGATVVPGGVQRRKRSNKGPTVEEMCETAAGKKTMRRMTPAAETEKRTSPTVGISLPPSSSSSASSSCTFFSPLVSSAPVVPSVVAKGPPLTPSSSSSCATVTLPILSVDSASRKRFLCDLCGDVSFLAMETLIGHQKYYCRNRPRPDDISFASSNGRALTGPNSAALSCTTTPHSSVAAVGLLNTAHLSSSSSSSPPAASPPLVQCPQCPFQTATNALLGQHQKQQHSLPVVCAECGYRALTVRGLRKHTRLSHNVTTAVEQQQQTETTNKNGNGYGRTEGTKHKNAMADWGEQK